MDPVKDGAAQRITGGKVQGYEMHDDHASERPENRLMASPSLHK